MTRFLAALTLALAVGAAHADQIGQTSPETYVSAYGRYRLTVFPLEAPYAFMDLKHREIRVKPLPRSEQVEQSAPEATLEQWAGNKYELVWRKPLANPLSPVSAIISARDGSFVTFDDWGQTGYGENVVVIYSGDGDIIKKFALSELMTEEQMQKVPRTMGSIQWGGHHIFVDADRVLLLRVAVDDESDSDKRKYRDVRIRMRDGAVIE
jgi:hypothetical protein